MALQGSRELRNRLKAIRTVFKPVGKRWANDTVALASRRVRVKSGKTRQSIRVKNASQRKASVEARHGARFLEAGASPHTLQPKKFQAMKFTMGGRPMFAKKVNHPGSPKQPFLRNSAKDALHRAPMLRELLKLWNNAA